MAKAGSVDVIDAVLFRPAGFTVQDGLDGLDGKSVEFVYRLHDSADEATFPAIPPTSVVNRNRDDYVPPNWNDGAPPRTALLPLILFSTRVRPRGMGAWGEFEPARLLTGEKGDPGENILATVDTVIIVRWWKLTATAEPPLIPLITDPANLLDTEYPPAPNEDWTRLAAGDSIGELPPFNIPTTALMPYLWEAYRYHVELAGGAGYWGQQYRGPFLVTTDPSVFGGDTSNEPEAALTASSTSIVRGNPATLFWSSANGVTGSINQGIGAVTLPSGDIAVRPTATTVYIFTVVGVAGTTPATAIVRINVTTPPESDDPVIDSFRATPRTINSGDDSVITWETTDALSVDIEGIGTDLPADGSRTVSPTDTTEYELTAHGATGTTPAVTAITVTVNPLPDDPTIDSFDATPDTIIRDGSSLLEWETTDALSVSIPGVGNNLPASGNSTVSPQQTTEYVLTATGATGTTPATARITITVNDPPLDDPTIDSFDATPDTIIRGGSSLLEWETSDAISVDILGVGSDLPASGSRSVSPNDTTEYVLTAHGAAGTTPATARITVTVNDPPLDDPTIDSFAPDPDTIIRGESSLLEWETTDAISVDIDGIGTDLPADGSRSVSPQQTTEYELTANGAAGTTPAVSRTTITVNDPPLEPVIDSFDATRGGSSDTIIRGGSSLIEWETTDALSVSIPGVGSNLPANGSRTVSPQQTTEYVLTATGAAGTTPAVSRTTITVNDPPLDDPVIDSFDATPNTIIRGGSSLLEWETTDAISVDIDGVGSNLPANGSRTVSPQQTTTYELTANGAAGTTPDTDSVTVTVNDPPPEPVITSFSAVPNNIVPGEVSVLSWETDDAVRVDITGVGNNLALNGTANVNPGMTRTYTLTARGAAGTTPVTATVTVTVRLPSIDSFTATPMEITEGGSSLLEWETTDASAASLSGVGPVARDGRRSVSPSVTTEYELTATSFSGTATARVTVTVNPAPDPPVIDSFTVDPDEISDGESVTLRWSTTDATSVQIEVAVDTVVYSTLSNLAEDGSRTNRPRIGDITFTLTATNSAGSVTSSVGVTVLED